MDCIGEDPTRENCLEKINKNGGRTPNECEGIMNNNEQNPLFQYQSTSTVLS